MEKTFWRKSVGVVYDTWWGAFALFVATGVVLFALQMLNGMLSDLVAWPKNIHLGLLFALWVNVGVAMVVSLFRRRFGRAAGQLALVVVAFFVYVFAALFSYCVPTRMTSAPCEEWIQERICKPTHIERSQLVFLGGIDMREEVVVFELIGELQDPECFVPGYAWGGGSSDMTKIGDHFRRLMKMGRVAVELPEEFDVSYFRRDGYYSILHKISAGGKTYLVFERL